MKLNLIYRKIKYLCARYKRSAKGAVSILLALVISPLLSVSLLLVESVRYQHAYEAAQEVIDGSAFAALAGYDSYLDERFGLLAVEQKEEIDESFGKYLDKNIDLLGKNVTVNSKNATGKLALTDLDVFKQQLLEYSEISVAVEVATEGIDLDKLLKELSEALNLKEVTKEIENLEKTVDVAQNIEKIVESLVDLIDINSQFQAAKQTYETEYSDFKDTLLDLVKDLKTAEQNLSDGASPEDAYKDSDVKEDIKQAEKDCDAYKKSAEDLKDIFEKLSEAISSLHSAAKGLASSIEKLNTAVTEESLAEKCTISTKEWIKSIVEEILKVMDELVAENYQQMVKDDKKKLEDQIEKLQEFDDMTVKSDWNESKIEAEYGPVSILSIKDNMSEKLNMLINILNEKTDVSESAKTTMSAFVDLIGTIMDFSGIYDSSLNAKVSESGMVSIQSPDLSSQLTMDSITDLVNACKELSGSFKESGIKKLVKLVKAVVKLLKALVEFLAAVVTWVGRTLYRFVSYVASGPKEWYNSILLYGYGAYNMPNRTTARTGKTLTGYAFSKIADLTGGVGSKSLTGAFKSLESIGDVSGTDKCFKGAETEYLIVGSTSELMNQSVTFFDLYLLRLVLDLYPVLKNDQVKQIAGMAGPGSWVVLVAVILGEPLLDSIMLVNGQPEYIFKKTVYLSYSGMPNLLKHLVKASGLATSLQDNLKKAIDIKNGEPKWEGLFEASYTEHMLLLLMLSVSPETYLKRLQNVVQMEAACKYESEYEFKLDKAYSYIYSEVEYFLNPMVNLDSLNNNGLFKATCKRYCGY